MYLCVSTCPLLVDGVEDEVSVLPRLPEGEEGLVNLTGETELKVLLFLLISLSYSRSDNVNV